MVNKVCLRALALPPLSWLRNSSGKYLLECYFLNFVSGSAWEAFSVCCPCFHVLHTQMVERQGCPVTAHSNSIPALWAEVLGTEPKIPSVWEPKTSSLNKWPRGIQNIVSIVSAQRPTCRFKICREKQAQMKQTRPPVS